MKGKYIKKTHTCISLTQRDLDALMLEKQYSGDSISRILITAWKEKIGDK